MRPLPAQNIISRPYPTFPCEAGGRPGTMHTLFTFSSSYKVQEKIVSLGSICNNAAKACYGRTVRPVKHKTFYTAVVAGDGDELHETVCSMIP